MLLEKIEHKRQRLNTEIGNNAILNNCAQFDKISPKTWPCASMISQRDSSRIEGGEGIKA